MTYKLFDVASVIRSKNAGPYEITFDIIFKEYEFYKKFVEAQILTKESFAKLYGISVDEVLGVISFHPAWAIKITIVRPLCSGGLGETDVYGAQQHSPLLAFEFEMQ